MCPEADVEKKYAWKLGVIFAWTLCGYAAVLGAGKDPGGLRHFGAVGLLSFCSVLSDPSGLQIAKGPWHPT